MGKPRKRIRPKPTYERSCLGKQRFDTLIAASAAAKHPIKKLRANGYMEAYKCRYCDGFHYGHPIRRKI